MFFIFLFYTEGWKKGGMTVNYRVLLFYKYTTIEDPESFAKEHLAFGKEIGIKGRILVAKEGSNGCLYGKNGSGPPFQRNLLQNR